MSPRKTLSTFSLLLMIAAFTLVAAHACFMHHGSGPSERCLLCSWGHGLALGMGLACAAVLVSLTGRILPEPALGFLPARLLQPFSARAPPSR